MERLSDDAELAELLNKENWPRTQGTDSASFGFNPQKVRRAPHAAAYIVRGPEGLGFRQATARWAAFLPLGDEPFERVPVGGDTDLTLILHGDFFPDVSRTRVNFPPDGDRGKGDISQRWNARLRDVGTLPLILTALDRLAADDAHDATRVTHGVLISFLFQRHRKPRSVTSGSGPSAWNRSHPDGGCFPQVTRSTPCPGPWSLRFIGKSSPGWRRRSVPAAT